MLPTHTEARTMSQAQLLSDTAIAGSTEPAPLIEVKNLRVVLPLIEGDLTASDGVSFTIAEGQTLGLVGESGCGKTITAQSLLGSRRAVPSPPARFCCTIRTGPRSTSSPSAPRIPNC